MNMTETVFSQHSCFVFPIDLFSRFGQAQNMMINFSPFVWQIAQDFGVKWYGLFYLIAFAFSFLMINWLGRRQNMGLDLQASFDLMLVVLVGILVGARLGYCLFYAPDLLIKFRSEFPYWGFFAIGEGGMSSHGAMLGVAAVVAIFSWQKGFNRPYILDVVALTGAWQIFCIRLGHFFTGDLWGREISNSAFEYAVKVPQEILFWPKIAPEKLSNLTSVVQQISEIKMTDWQQALENFKIKGAVDLPTADRMQDLLQQILASSLGANTNIADALSAILPLRHPWPLYAAALEGGGIFLFLLIFWYQPRRSGLIAALFISLYSIARFGDEFYREADWFAGPQWLDLSRGQWLSLASFLVGAWMLLFYGRQGSIAKPGWGLGPNVRLHRK